MKFTTVDTHEDAGELSVLKDRNLYLLRPNGLDSILLEPTNDFGMQFSTKIISCFVDDNFPQFKDMPVDQRVNFGLYLLNSPLLESSGHVFINLNYIDANNSCLTAYLNQRCPDKAHIGFIDAEAPLPDVGGLSVMALIDIGIIEYRSMKVSYPIKLATSPEHPYESFTGVIPSPIAVCA